MAGLDRLKHKNRKSHRLPGRRLCWEVRCICDGRYKLTINLMTTDELYDLESDRSEMNNLIRAQEHAATRDQVHDRLLEWMNTSRDAFRGYYWGRRAWRTKFPVTWDNAGYTRQRE